MSYTTLRDSEPISRVDRRCALCNKIIPAGERHIQHVGVFEGDLQDDRLHQKCESIVLRYLEFSACDGYYFYSDVNEWFAEETRWAEQQ